MVSPATVPGAAAAVAAPRIGIGPAAMHPGGKVTVTGQGWLPNATVAIRLGTGSVAARVDGTGRFTARVLVPWATVPGMVTVRASQGGRAATGRLRVGLDWRMAGFSKARNFVNPYEKQLTKDTVANLKVGGRFAVGGEAPDNAFAWLATLAGRGYACTITGNIAPFDLASRRVLWEYHEDNPSEIQYSSGDGGPYLDASSGTIGLQRFMMETSAYVWGSRGDLTFPYAGKLLVGGTHCVSSLPGAFDPKTGEFAWVAYDAGVFELTLTSAGVLYSVGGQPCTPQTRQPDASCQRAIMLALWHPLCPDRRRPDHLRRRHRTATLQHPDHRPRRSQDHPRHCNRRRRAVYVTSTTGIYDLTL